MATDITSIDEHEVVFDAGAGPLVPKGEYLAELLWHETKSIFGDAKVFLHFHIKDLGPYLDTQLYLACRAQKLLGKPGKRRKFRVGKRYPR
jgi:hypothetical protein